MAAEEAPTVPFFVAGGTVPPGSPSYVARAADRELYEALLAGEYCFVLNSRQMGKSSLAVRTISKLGDAGVRTAFVDLTRIGGANVTPEQWYAGLLLETGRALCLRAEAAAWLKDHRDVGPAQRLLSFLQESVLGRVEGQIVLMLDEIDAVRSLGFSTDELFSGLRQLNNGRASDLALLRLTVCLLGAALPGDLIRDPRTTPFNVGRRVELRDFTPEEARPFAAAIGETRLTRLLGWTGGHPFLTQALGAELAADPLRNVNTLVRARYLDARAREADTNLADVGRRLLGDGDPNVTDEDRATTLSLYTQMLKGKAVPDDEANPAAARIKMSGVARVKGGILRVRNRIYAEAFDARWVRDNTPGQELRRQRRAFWRGAIRAGLAAVAVLAVVSSLAVVATRNAREARRERDHAEALRAKARYDAYVASMQTMLLKSEEGDGETARRTLQILMDDPSRGWEYAYWKNAIDGGAKALDWRGEGIPNIAADPRGTWLGVADADSLTIYDLQGQRRTRVALPHAAGEGYRIGAFRSGDRFVVQNRTTRLALVIDAPTGRVLRRRALKGFFGTQGRWDSPGDRMTLTWSNLPLRTFRLDLDNLRETPLPGVPTPVSSSFSPRSDRVVFRESDGSDYFVTMRRTKDLSRIWSTKATYPYAVDFDPTGASVVVANGGTLRRIDAETSRVIDAVPLPGSADGVQFSPDGSRLLVERWGEKAQEFSAKGALRPVRSFFDLRARYVVGGRLLTSSVEVRLRYPAGGHVPRGLRLPVGGSVAGIRTGRRVVITGAKGRIEINPNDPLRFRTLGRLSAGTSLLDVTGRFAMSVRDGAKTLQFDDLEGHRRPIRVPYPDLGGWGYFGVSPRGDRLAFPLDATHLQVYDTDARRRIATLTGISGAALPRFSDDGRWLVAGDEAGHVGVWDAATWRCLAIARLGRDEIQCVTFSPNGGQVAVGSKFGDLGVLDLRTGSARRLEGTTQSVVDVAWSPDGRRLASGGSDREVRLWDAATGRDLGAIGRHDAEVAALWFTRDGRTLCSVDQGGTLKLWTTGKRR